MHWMLTPAAAILFFTTVLVAVADWMIWLRRKASGGMVLLGLISAVLFWSLTGALEASSVGLSQKLFWSKLSYLGIAPAAPLLLLFTLNLAHRKGWVTPVRSAVVWSVPALTIILAASNDIHHLIWISTNIDPLSNLIVYQHGPAFWVYTAYAYLCIALANYVLISEFRHSTGSYRNQLGAIMVSSLFPWIGSLIYLSGFDPLPGLDTTIVFFAAMAITLASAIAQSHLLDLVPIAHESVFQQMQDGFIVIDAHDRVAEANPAAAYLLNKLALPLGKDINETFKAWPALANVLLEKPRLPAEIYLPGSIPRYLDVRVTSITDVHGYQQAGCLAVLRDITDRKRAEAAARAKSDELERISVTDELTGLSNRRAADQFLLDEFERCKRYNLPLALSLLDLDDFKQINDAFGHPGGDAAIRSVADMLRASIRGTDMAARYGGDEFLIVMPNTDMQQAYVVIERIRTTTGAKFLELHGMHISISAGVTGWSSGDTPDEALRRVDQLLYSAKNHGKNCIITDRRTNGI